MTTSSQNMGKPEENRYQLVNNVAKRAKIMISHDSSSQLSNHRAIHAALQNKEEPAAAPPPQPTV